RLVCREPTKQHCLPPAPRIKRLPLGPTSRVPSVGSLGMAIGACQVIPPSVERWNSTTPVLSQSAPSLDWYWKPCPGPPVLSIVNHCLSPPPASPSACSSVQDWPPLVDRYMFSQNV